MTATPSLRPPPFWQIWNNPIFRRYCRSRLRKRGLGVSLVIVWVISGFMFLFIPAVTKRSDRMRLDRQEFMTKRVEQLSAQGKEREAKAAQLLLDRMKARQRPLDFYERTPIFPLLILQGIILFLFGAGQVAGGMTAEADEGSIDYQRLTPITPLSKTLGYLFGLPIREYVLFLATLPLTGICLWNGNVPASAWLPVYGVFLSSVLLYHLTGLVAGTVVKNKRWAFLLSMGLVFLLYTVVPQGARFGFPFVKYLTLWPVLVEHAAVVAPKAAENMILGTGITPGTEVPFFNVSFSDLAFTLLVQGTFILAMIVMIWRKWKRAESHLLSKAWGVLIFAWIHLLIIGNALPMAEDGDLFPSQNLRRTEAAEKVMRELDRREINLPETDPTLYESAFIIFVFAVNLMLVIMLLTIMMTPNVDSQVRGLRRATKLGKRNAPWYADESSAFPIMVLLVLAGSAAWYWFQRSIMGSHWFDSQREGMGSAIMGTIRIALVLGLTSFAFHALLESRGGKRPFLAVVFFGIVPIMAAMILQVTSRTISTSAMWLAGISPFTQLAYATELMLPEKFQLPTSSQDHIPKIFQAWTILMGGFVLWNWISLRNLWKQRAQVREVPEK
jgi:hypothetical protein